jgi:hypothetical protein
VLRELACRAPHVGPLTRRRVQATGRAKRQPTRKARGVGERRRRELCAPPMRQLRWTLPSAGGGREGDQDKEHDGTDEREHRARAGRAMRTVCSPCPLMKATARHGARALSEGRDPVCTPQINSVEAPPGSCLLVGADHSIELAILTCELTSPSATR